MGCKWLVSRARKGSAERKHGRGSLLTLTSRRRKLTGKCRFVAKMREIEFESFVVIANIEFVQYSCTCYQRRRHVGLFAARTASNCDPLISFRLIILIIPHFICILDTFIVFSNMNIPFRSWSRITVSPILSATNPPPSAQSPLYLIQTSLQPNHSPNSSSFQAKSPLSLQLILWHHNNSQLGLTISPRPMIWSSWYVFPPIVAQPQLPARIIDNFSHFGLCYRYHLRFPT